MRGLSKKSIKADFIWVWGALIGTLVIAAIWKVPQWQAEAVPNTGTKPITPKERAEIENQSRGVLVQALGGLFFVVTASLTWKNIQNTEDKQLTERFSKAVEMLGDEKIEVRLGGIYLLERIAKDSPEDHWTVMEVLTSFVREKSPYGRTQQRPVERFRSGQIKPNAQIADIVADIQAVITVIGRRAQNDSPHSHLDLRGANLGGADLIGADLIGANLGGANLIVADISEANLSKARLSGVNLIGANFSRARLSGAILSGAILRRTTLRGASINKAFLARADLMGADLARADLMEADLRGADLMEADLRGANLSGACLGFVDLKDIRWDTETTWKDVQGLDTAQNIPEDLKQQLGLTSLPHPSSTLANFEK